MSDSPNMNLPIPVPGSTAGPQYASDIDDCLLAIDAHDHSPGNGVPVGSLGMNINADLTFNGYSAIAVSTVSYNTLLVTPSTTEVFYSKNGEAAWRDKVGNEVILTANGSVAGATGTITGLSSPASATYSSITKSVTFLQDTAKPAKLNISDLSHYKFNDTSGAALTIKWAPATPVSYTTTLPDALPATDDSVAKTDLSGVQTYNAFGLVPVGGIIAIADNVAGSFTVPTSGTSSRGWQLCDGATIEAAAVLSGVTPTLNDSRFLMGSTSSGTQGGSNASAITGTQSMSHTHNFAHTHVFGFLTGELRTRSSSDRNSTTVGASGAGTGTALGGVSVASGGNSALLGTAFVNNLYTTGVTDASNGSSGGTATTATDGVTVNFANATLNAGDIRPKFLSTKFLIRIK